MKYYGNFAGFIALGKAQMRPLFDSGVQNGNIAVTEATPSD